MKIKSTLAILGLFFTALLFMNNSGGAANVQETDRTGSPNSPGACGTVGCHANGAFDPSVTIEVFRNDMPVMDYIPGENHTISITVEAGEGVPSGYGFQTTILNSANEKTGNFGAPSIGQQLVTLPDGSEFMEHFGPSTTNSFMMTWIAPVTGTGEVTIYAAGNAVNGNFLAVGDGAATADFILTESLINNTDNFDQNYNLAIYPNPLNNQLNVKINSRNSGTASITITDVGGKTIFRESLEIIQGEIIKTVDTSELENGIFFITILTESETITETIVKI